jgi:hypothetical protein
MNHHQFITLTRVNGCCDCNHTPQSTGWSFDIRAKRKILGWSLKIAYYLYLLKEKKKEVRKHCVDTTGKAGKEYRKLSLLCTRQEWRCSSTIFSSALYGCELLDSRSGRFITRENFPATRRIGGWVGSRSVLEAVEKRKICCPPSYST